GPAGCARAPRFSAGVAPVRRADALRWLETQRRVDPPLPLAAALHVVWLAVLGLETQDAQEKAREHGLHAESQQHRSRYDLAHGQARVEGPEVDRAPRHHRRDQ